MKSRDGKSQWREEKKKEDPGARKGWKVAKHCVFPICGSGGSKSRPAGAAGADPAGRWEMKNCTPLRREKHFEGKMYKTHFWALRCRKSARRCGAKHISKSKVYKTEGFRALLEVEMSKKCTPLWREAHFEVKSAKNCGVGSAFGRSEVLSRGRCQGLCTLSKVSKTWEFCSISKNDGRRGAFDEDLQRWISRGRRSTRDMFIRAVRRSAGLLRWFCVTSAALRMTWLHFFVAGAVV